MTEQFPPTWIVTGPTAGGKTDLSKKVSKHFELPVLSMDSMKIYQKMDIGSAKPSNELIDQLPYHMVNLRKAWESFSVAEYLEEVAKLIPTLPRPLYFSGGTAFYLYAMVEGICDGPEISDEVRQRVEIELKEQSLESLAHKIQQLDPSLAANMDLQNPRRVQRALEVLYCTDQKYSDLRQERQPYLKAGQHRIFAIARPREQMDERINLRVERMFADGWVEEVEKLMAEHDPAWGREAAQSIGYEEIRKALVAGENPLERMPIIQQRTRRFARSQLKWFRRLGVEWFAPEESDLLLDCMAECKRLWEAGQDCPVADPERVARRY